MAGGLVLFMTLIIACSLSSVSMAKTFECGLGLTLTSKSPILNQILYQVCDSECYTYIVIRQDVVDESHADLGIAYCQSKGVKLLLSLVKPENSSGSLIPPQLVASVVWEKYLNPINGANAKFDGIDFAFTTGDLFYYYELGFAFKNYSNEIILSASPGCAWPNTDLDLALRSGLLNVLWPKFFNNHACDASGGLVAVESTWNNWTKSISPVTKLFYGLPTSPDGVESGYLSPLSFEDNVLPNIRYTDLYGGAMLWNFEDQVNNLYASEIAKPVCDYRYNITCHPPNNGGFQVL